MNETIYYPQDELTTMLLPVTHGCPHNKCSFCSMYKDDKYSLVPLSDIEFQLMHGYEYTEKLFLTGADPLSAGFERIEKILLLIKKHLPYCARTACYASCRSVLKLSEQQLSYLHDLGLRLLYIGFESGDDEILKSINKGSSLNDAMAVGKRLNEIHLPFNSIIMYGIGGSDNFYNHAINTAKMLSSFKSQKIITMNLTVFDNTPLSEKVRSGEFVEQSNFQKLSELKLILEHLRLEDETVFDTTHPTNIIKIKGTVPKELPRLLRCIDESLNLKR